MKEKNKFKVLVIVVILLGIIVICLGGYIVYDKMLNSDSVDNGEKQNDGSNVDEDFLVVKNVVSTGTMIGFEPNGKCYNGCKKIVEEAGKRIEVYAERLILKIGNKEVLNLKNSTSSIKQVTILNDIVIVSTPSIKIYDLEGNLLKEIVSFYDEYGRKFLAYMYFDRTVNYLALSVTYDGKIQFVGTKHTQGAQNTYMDDNGNSIDICNSNISDDSIVSGIFEFSYLGNGEFSDITYVSTRSTVKDLKSCN